MTSQKQKIALIAINNSITAGRINTIMKEKGWSCKKTSDGDKTVDQYVEYNPEIVFVSLDLTSIDGHITALEIREIDPNARIVFVSSKTRLSKAQDAAYSAGAVGVLITPLTKSKINEKWKDFFSEIPDAPGLDDLDELYPELIHKEETTLPPLPLPELILPPKNITFSDVTKEKKRKRKITKIIFILLTISTLIGVIFYSGLIDTTSILPK